MDFFVEYELGNLIVDDKDDHADLIGTKIVGELLFVCYPEEGDILVKSIGEYLIYIFNEHENDIFDSADAHSQRLADMISNVKLETDHILYEFNGEDMGIDVDGKIAVLEDFRITDSKIPAAEDLRDILDQIVQKVGKIFDVDYFLTDEFAFSEEIKNKNVVNLLEEIGFVKSGNDGLIRPLCIDRLPNI